MESLIADAYDRTQRINLMVGAVNQAARNVKKTEAGFSRWGVRQEIDSSLGHVVVNGNGDLIRVELDTQRVPLSDVSRLGDRIISAINAAEQRARNARLRRIKESLGDIHY